MDDRLFRNAMGKFATGVTVITTELDGEAHGMTANAFMSVSLNPKLVVISIGERAKMLEKIKESGKFAVNILAAEQQEVSMLFAGQLKEKREAEFGRIKDMPVIKEALANIVCNVHSTQVAGDHTLFIGEVQEIVLREGTPLTFFEGKYGQLAEEQLV
ncbi:flavin reductase family protein [Bacillus badius]|uniref:Nitrilotriacetate monooxygenase component B n=1 Tax=Bacillus badius TaxID=1455 RepID=A0ABR5AXE8_BACBA|nr:flavin reductase family protein [Bacillus badius]KIL76011.1 Nitrilotriacetate monooxygenase component B [Bacillus badius]KIL79429.1 Nitrilotriacetate monooxygenase component B [Bacillus badius]KZR59653.1 flavin reductase [Bacillus badius]MED4716604.1 flavin reductase family protein [Bacillus badius]